MKTFGNIFSLKLHCFILLTAYFLCFAQSDFKYIPDQGKRLDGVSIAHAVLVNDTFYLYWNNGPDHGLGISEDGINFTQVDMNSYPNQHAPRMPNGIYRRFRKPQQEDNVSSDSSINRIQFFKESGIRYYLPASDSGFWGVNTFFNDPEGGVGMIYIGGRSHTHFCKMAYSPPGDNGKNFTLYKSDVLNDSAYGGGSFSHVDPYGMILPDSSVRIFTMNQHGPPFPPQVPKGFIYSFISNDYGKTFQQEFDTNGDSLRLHHDDFTEYDVYSLNDPKVVRLSDGRYRMYITALIDSLGSKKQSIVSATTPLITAVQNSAHHSNLQLITIKSKQSSARIVFNLTESQKVQVKLFTLHGCGIKTLADREFAAGTHCLSFGLKGLARGLYVCRFKTSGISQSRLIRFLEG